MMDRLLAMETFVRVFETGSFSAAARQLHVGQPAVSKTIAQLERHLGTRLLSRTTRGLSPTDAGQRYYERARRAIDEAAEAEMAAKDAAAALTGRLRVSTAVTFARMHVVPYLGAFLDAHPALELELMMNDSHTDLIEAGADVALRFGPAVDSALTGRVIAQSPRVVVATPSYFRLYGEPKSPTDLLEGRAVVIRQPGLDEVWTFRRGEERCSVTLTGRLKVDAAEGARAAVLADLGFAVATEWMFAPELTSGAVRRTLRDWTLPSVNLWAVYPTGRLVSAKARAFVAFVEKRLGNGNDGHR
jgi:DNA-binding transcriptional LysR family regulator